MIELSCPHTCDPLTSLAKAVGNWTRICSGGAGDKSKQRRERYEVHGQVTGGILTTPTCMTLYILETSMTANIVMVVYLSDTVRRLPYSDTLEWMSFHRPDVARRRSAGAAVSGAAVSGAVVVDVLR